MNTNLHKLVRQSAELSNVDLSTLEEILSVVRRAREDFDNVGVEFSYDKFKEYFERAYKEELAKNNQYYTRLKNVIYGNNLDIIEEAAVEKGLIPKE
jgi:hypothetical protein